MKPRATVITAYMLGMLGLIGFMIHRTEIGENHSRRAGIEWSRFSEAPTCTKTIDELLPNRSIITVTGKRPARIEVETIEQCKKGFAGFVADFEGLYVLTVTSEQHLAGSFEYEVVFCLCPHRFVYEFGPDFQETNEIVFVKHGRVVATYGEP
jgi:hypothetical protein